MNKKIIYGDTVGTPMVRPDWTEENERSAAYIRNKPQNLKTLDKFYCESLETGSNDGNDQLMWNGKQIMLGDCGIKVVTELPETAEYGDVCALIRNNITIEDVGRKIIFDYSWLDNLIGNRDYFAFDNYGIVYELNMYDSRRISWFSIQIVNDFGVYIEFIVQQHSGEYAENFKQWNMRFAVGSSGKFELSTDENDIDYQKSYFYDSVAGKQSSLLSVLDSIDIPAENIDNVEVEKLDNFTFNVFTLEPILMMFCGEWIAIANESKLYKQKGALISDLETITKIDGKEYLRLYFNWGNDTTKRRWVDIPVAEIKNVTENSGGLILNGAELDFGIPDMSDIDASLPVAYINDDGELIFEIGGDVTNAWLNDKGELEVELS